MNIIKKQHNYWEMIWVLAKTDFKLRYHGSFLGFIWVLIKPLSQFVILNFVFSNIFHSGKEYSLGLFTAIILWGFFSEGTMVGMMSLLSKSHILTKIYIPKWIIVLSSTINTLLNFSLNILVLGLFFVVYGIYPSPFFIMIFLYYCLVLYSIIVSFSFLTAPLFVRYRDLNQLWEVFLMAGFYAAPIIYPMQAMPAWVQTLLYFNPMTFIIMHAKNLLIKGQFVQPWHHIIYITIVFVMFVISSLIFIKTSKRVTEHL